MGKQGSILITVLWVMLILSLIVWGLSKRSAMGVSLLETYEGKLRAYAAARAGINQMLDLISRSPSDQDNLKQVGVKIPQGKTAEDVFGKIQMHNGAYAVVQWHAKDFASDDKVILGLEDEGGKININAINELNLNILKAYLQIKKLDSTQAQAMARAIVTFSRYGTGQPNQNWLEFDAPGAGQRLKPKGRPYQHLDELLEVEGMTSQIFDRIKDGLTVYGNAATGLSVNVRTASKDVIAAFIHAAKELEPMLADEEMLQNALQMRDGSDGRSFTNDDGTTAFNVDTATWPAGLKEGVSPYVRVIVQGIDPVSHAVATIDAVIERGVGFGGCRLVSWYRQ